jgi:hypothetical protein
VGTRAAAVAFVYPLCCCLPPLINSLFVFLLIATSIKKKEGEHDDDEEATSSQEEGQEEAVKTAVKDSSSMVEGDEEEATTSQEEGKGSAKRKGREPRVLPKRKRSAGAEGGGGVIMEKKATKRAAVENNVVVVDNEDARRKLFNPAIIPGATLGDLTPHRLVMLSAGGEEETHLLPSDVAVALQQRGGGDASPVPVVRLDGIGVIDSRDVVESPSLILMGDVDKPSMFPMGSVLRITAKASYASARKKQKKGGKDSRSSEEYVVCGVLVMTDKNKVGAVAVGGGKTHGYIVEAELVLIPLDQVTSHQVNIS